MYDIECSKKIWPILFEINWFSNKIIKTWSENCYEKRIY